jgi:segregation and condensation protein B
MEREKLRSVLESLLFSSERPLGVKELRALIEDVETPALVEALREMGEHYRAQGRGFQLHEVAGGFQLRTSPENGEFVRRMLGAKPVRLSRAALETLAIIAYRQPVTRAEIEDVRGVDSGGILKMLLERRLIKMLGKKEEVGRPMLYGTTKEFLEFFSLRDLKQLPTLREFHELSDESLQKLQDAGLGEAVAGPPANDGPEEPPEETVVDAAPADEAPPAAAGAAAATEPRAE